jgi:3-oxoacyl-(acyl-carrier-protein) synthase
VTGMGVYCAAGASVDELWRRVSLGLPNNTEYSWADKFDRHSYPVFLAPEINTRDPILHAARKMDRSVQMAMLAAQQAIAHAAIPKNYFLADRMGVIVGTSRGPWIKCVEAHERMALRKYHHSDKPTGDQTNPKARPDKNEGILSEKGFDGGVNNMPGYPKSSLALPSLAVNTTFSCIAGVLAQTFQFKGPSLTVSAACASGAVAIALGAQQILMGLSDAVLVGGTEAPIHPSLIAQFAAGGLLAIDEHPSRACKPFDRMRNGLVLGEGAAFLLLESISSVKKRRARVLGQLAGWAYNNDGAGRIGLTPSGDGLLRTMNSAINLAGVSTEQIDYINAHGTGTVLNDRTEAASVRRFSENNPQIPCGSTKPITGHCLGATAAIEAVISVAALEHQLIPPTINYEHPDPECPLDVVPVIARKKQLSTVMTNSLGFWGNYASLVFRRMDAPLI